VPNLAFLSDNAAPAHPAVVRAIEAANVGYAPPYGEDEWTRRARERIRDLLGDVEVVLVFNGTGANTLALSTLVKPHECVLAARGAHVVVDEAGALERFAGSRAVPVEAPDGKLRRETLEPLLARRGDQHAVQPRAVTITNATELGTVYAPAEVRALARWCHERGLLLHCDGARLANAAVAHDGNLKALVDGLDVLSFGATKNGMLYGEAIVFFDRALARDAAWTRKQGMQLASKQRYLGAQLDALLADGLWLENARHANRMAALLAREARAAGIELARPTEANMVFARLPRAAIAKLQAEWPCYVWDEATGEVRWVCSWDTDERDVRALVASARRALA
jgi:threonine aldolase